MKLEKLYPETIYHISGKTIGNEIAFANERNIKFFLSRFKDYIVPVADTYSYCLLPTEYHFLLEFSDPETILRNVPNASVYDICNALSWQMGKFILSYTDAVNEERGRKGGLFMRPFRRYSISDAKDALYVMRKIHRLPLQYKLCNHVGAYRYSSYSRIKQDAPSFLNNNFSLGSFVSLKKFEDFHNDFPPDNFSMAA